MTNLQPRHLNHRLSTLALALAIVSSLGPFAAVQASDPLTVGYKGFAFPAGTGGDSAPTGEKPESKLWHNDSSWWGVLWSETSSAFNIYKLNETSQDWEDSTTVIDTRNDAKMDVLWDEGSQKLFIASHIFQVPAVAAATPAERGRLYRFSYNNIDETYTLDAGFPVDVNDAKTDTLVLAQDSTGRLWVTFTFAQTIMVNASGALGDTDWDPTTGPFALPVGAAATVLNQDIPSVISFGTDIGVMWSNQVTNKTYFSVHPDSSDPADDWSAAAVAYEGAGALSSDNHINLATLGVGDPAGEVFAIVKTTESPARLLLLVCATNCTSPTDWTAHDAFIGSDSVNNPTRPIVLLDPDNRLLYVLATARDLANERDIYYKVTDLDAIYFDTTSIGTPFIQDNNYAPNNITSTKQNLTATSGLTALASNSTHYGHNSFLPPLPAPDIEVDPGSHEYGSVALLDNSAQAFQVSNSGTRPLNVSGGSVIGTNLTEFAIDSGGGAFAIAPGETHDVVVSFNPTSNGAKNATLRLSSDDPDEGTFDVALSGHGGIIPEITVTPSTIDYGDKVVGKTALFTVVVTNDGSADLTVSGTDITGPDAARFNIESGGGPFVLVPAASRNVVVGFTPNAITAFDATLEISSNDMDEPQSDVTLTGTGVAAPLPGILWQETKSGGSATSLTVATTAPMTGAADDLYLAAVSIKPGGTVSSVSGLGLTWTVIDTQCSGLDNTTVSIWKAFGTSSTFDGIVTATLPSTPSNAVLAVSRYSGVSAIGAEASANTNGAEGACSLGVDSAGYSIGLTTTGAGSVVFSAAAMRNRTHTPGAGYEERAEVLEGSGGAAASVAVQDQAFGIPGAVTASGTFSDDVDWAVVALELKRTVLAPTISKSFSPSTIDFAGTSTITFTLDNTGNAIALTGANFTDSYVGGPANMVNATPLVVGGSCTGVTTGAVAGGTSFDVTSANVSAGASCTITVNVTGATASGTNTTSVLHSNEAPDSETGASATLNVNEAPAPTISKSFTPSTIEYAGDSTITFTLANTGPLPLTGVNFTDSYLGGPANMVNATPLSIGGTCAAVSTSGVFGGSANFDVTNATVPANGSCTITVDVTGATASGTNTTSVLGSNEAPDSAVGGSATLDVNDPPAPTISKSFTPSTINYAGDSTITFTLANTGPLPLTGVNFTDSYVGGPANMVNATPLSIGGTCADVATPAVSSGSANFDVTDATVPADGSCTITVDVAGATASGTNTTSVLHSNEAPDSAFGGSATLTVLPPLMAPTITKNFSPSVIQSGETTVITFILSNTNAMPLTGANFTDSYASGPAGLVNGTPVVVAWTCADVVTTAFAGGTSFDVTSATIPASDSCTITVEVTGATQSGNNTTSVLSTNEAPDSVSGGDAWLTVVDGLILFVDGFGSGNTSGWSQTVN